jgi:hypothetical protein
MQLCVVHVDHHAWHDRSQLPLQAHFALETRPLFRLIPYWTRLDMDVTVSLPVNYPPSASVAQLDRVSASEAEGRGFDSRRARHVFLSGNPQEPRRGIDCPHNDPHPGEMLAEGLDELGVSRTALSGQIFLPAKRMGRLINGKRAITWNTACASRSNSPRARGRPP